MSILSFSLCSRVHTFRSPRVSSPFPEPPCGPPVPHLQHPPPPPASGAASSAGQRPLSPGLHPVDHETRWGAQSNSHLLSTTRKRAFFTPPSLAWQMSFKCPDYDASIHWTRFSKRDRRMCVPKRTGCFQNLITRNGGSS